jgi:hypothetical protein
VRRNLPLIDCIVCDIRFLLATSLISENTGASADVPLRISYDATLCIGSRYHYINPASFRVFGFVGVRVRQGALCQPEAPGNHSIAIMYENSRDHGYAQTPQKDSLDKRNTGIRVILLPCPHQV